MRCPFRDGIQPAVPATDPREFYASDWDRSWAVRKMEKKDQAKALSKKAEAES